MRGHFIFFIFIFLFLKIDVGYAQLFDATNSSLSDSSRRKPRPIKLIDINDAVDQTTRKIHKFTKELANINLKINIDSLIISEEEFLKEEAELFDGYNPNNLSLYFLENDYRAWLGYQNKLNDANKIIYNKLNTIEHILQELEWDYEVWSLTLKKISKTKNVPVGTKKKIRQILFDISNLKQQYTEVKKKLIVWDNKISDLLMLSTHVISRISTLQRNLRDSLFVSNKEPIWKITVGKKDILPFGERIKRAVKDNLRIIRNFLSQHKFNWIFVFALLLTVFYFRLRKKYLAAGFDNNMPGHVHRMILLEKHWLTTYFILLLTLWLSIISIMPLSLTFLLATFMLLCVYKILPEFLGRPGKIRVLMIIILYFLNEFEIFMWYFGNLSRYYLFFESLVGLTIVYYFGVNKFKRPPANSSIFLKRTFILSIFLMGAYGLAFITNILGYVNLTVMLLKIAAQSATIILLIFSIQKILKLLISAVCELGRANKYSALAGYWDKIERKVLQFIDVLAIFFGLKLILGIMELYRSLYEGVVNVLTSEIVIGKISLTLGGVLGMFLIIFLSYFLAKSFEIILTNHKYIKKKISSGVAFAIASTTKYILVFVGIIFGMSYAGIDVGKFSLFTGALGVGIGFGLQNIVNNFISGLILLYERPVEVGDTVEVGKLMGVVKKIGVRASRIHTYDGAEVVVPNGNIISNDLINWTLSDDKRRLEIKVGVAYGSDVNLVMKVLQKVALDHEKVFPDPPPRALFEEFGDSSLNFRLLCWIPFDSGLSIRSDLSVAIYNAFKEEGIEIPFPQMDIHVKDVVSGTKTEKPQVVVPPAPANEPEIVKPTDKKENKPKKTS